VAPGAAVVGRDGVTTHVPPLPVLREAPAAAKRQRVLILDEAHAEKEPELLLPLPGARSAAASAAHVDYQPVVADSAAKAPAKFPLCRQEKGQPAVPAAQPQSKGLTHMIDPAVMAGGNGEAAAQEAQERAEMAAATAAVEHALQDLALCLLAFLGEDNLDVSDDGRGTAPTDNATASTGALDEDAAEVEACRQLEHLQVRCLHATVALMLARAQKLTSERQLVHVPCACHEHNVAYSCDCMATIRQL
jgi:hypothetical protein